MPRRCWAICAAAVPLHLVLALGTELSPDEAYYLCAARAHGGLPPIADHPPLLPWLLKLGDVAGPVELRARLGAVILGFAVAVGAVALARARGASSRGSEITAWVMSWALLPTAGAFLATPDGLLLLGLVAALFLVERGRLIGAGATLAAAALAKVVALPIAVVLALADPRMRWPTIGALAFIMPFVAPSLGFQLQHAFVDRPEPWSVAGALGALVAAALAQIALWTPLTLVAGIGVLRARRGNHGSDRWLVGGLTALVVASALVRGVPPEPNWWAPAALLVAVAAAQARWTPRARVALVGLLLVPTLVAAAHTLHPFLPLAVEADPTARLHGWRQAETAPLDAPGIGEYGPAAEACIYRGKCTKINDYFQTLER